MPIIDRIAKHCFKSRSDPLNVESGFGVPSSVASESVRKFAVIEKPGARTYKSVDVVRLDNKTAVAFDYSSRR